MVDARRLRNAVLSTGEASLDRALWRLWLPVIAVCFSQTVRAQQEVDRTPRLNLGDAVVTGFSGTIGPDPLRTPPLNTSPVDLTFINPDGASARLMGLGRPGYTWDGRLFPAPKLFDVYARDTGQVFGVALDDEPTPNIYLAATSVFGLNIVARGRDGQPQRRKVGGPGSGWMQGQFGLNLQGDPGSIYKVDGTTGAVTLFTKVLLNGVPNSGPALGNLAYDAAHKQLFVSDLQTGMIHRFAITDGAELGAPFDHGVTGRRAANLATAPFNSGARANIASNRFNTEAPDTWGFALPQRRVWALATHKGRLFYSVGNGARGEGPQIWSVGIQPDGALAPDPRLELNAPSGPNSVSDIAFTQRGAMILAQRAPIAASYDYSAFTQASEPRVLRYWLKDPNDPPSPGFWKPAAEEYAVGLAANFRNTNGGVALGYGYDQDGALNTAACEAALWTTGQHLRNNPALRLQLAPGGPLLVHGLQGSSAEAVRAGNTPPMSSYFVDYDDKFDDPRATGHLGSVRVLAQPCLAIAGAPASPPYVSGPSGDGSSGGGGGGGCIGVGCPPPPPPPPPNACFTGRGDFECDPRTGVWTYRLTVSGPGWINTITATSLTPGVTTTAGPISLNPANIATNGPPGASAVIEICAFNATAAASGRPYDCCRDRVRVTIPNRACGVRR